VVIFFVIKPLTAITGSDESERFHRIKMTIDKRKKELSNDECSQAQWITRNFKNFRLVGIFSVYYFGHTALKKKG
jgi:hypothetical protein